ncbi:hypothetical protein LTV02_06595 [Nocardia yamanashiensis]|uniref:hypothetical protein n=1 Tax=Nocardia yamanashiensis TaxID=209247 RepID=UPI001E4584D8|nr:hypothetical protein [Nocardia yamanashiensis]UGT43056.1 hypothetical protein LTV02_06595 [Nocardia yamanashiensis]
MKSPKSHFAALLVPTLVLLGGCGFLRGGNVTQTPSSGDSEVSHYSEKQLCSDFAAFLKNDLSLDADQFIRDELDKPIGYSGGCVQARPGGGRIAQLVMSRSLVADTIEPEEPGFQPQAGMEEKAWLAPDDQFRVQVGRWIGTMDIDVDNLKLTDEQTRRSFEFLIRVTRAVRG